MLQICGHPGSSQNHLYWLLENAGSTNQSRQAQNRSLLDLPAEQLPDYEVTQHTCQPEDSSKLQTIA